MAILRDTRAKIDPRLLDAMKDTLSAVMPAAATAPQTAPPPKKETVFKREDAVEAPKNARPAAAVSADGTEQVDKQKVAQIVLQYMKNREDKQKH